MGRRIPVDERLIVYPVLFASLLGAVGMAATIAIMSSLCAAYFRKKSPPEPEPPLNITAEEEPPPATAIEVDRAPEKPTNLPLPSGGVLNKTYSSNQLTRSKSRGKLAKAAHMSMKVKRSMSVAKLRDMKRDVKEDLRDLKKEVKGDLKGLKNEVKEDLKDLKKGVKEDLKDLKKGKLKHKEDMLWKKGIILGEKNRFAQLHGDDEDEDDDGDEIDVPSGIRSNPVSRTNSLLIDDDEEEVASLAPGRERLREEEAADTRKKD